MRVNKLIIDTNIWVSYSIKKRTAELADMILMNDCTVYSCDQLIDELADVLRRDKFKKYINSPVADYVSLHKELTISLPITLRFNQSPDPKDNFLFDLAEQSNCRLIITGDRKLLAVDGLEGIGVKSLTWFRETIRNQQKKR